MDRFDAMKLFVRIVELGNFSKAADDLKIPAATATYAIRQLEARLGVQLLHRTTRKVTASTDGQAYYQRCLRILADVEETEAGFGHRGVLPKGKLRVDLPTTARFFVLPRLHEFMARFPDIEVEIGMGDRHVDLIGEGVDCVLRIGELRDSSMVGRRVATLAQVTCASADYLDRHGMPQSIEALLRHQAVNWYAASSGRLLPFEFLVDGVLRTVQVPGRVSVSGGEAYVACCVGGLGLAQLPRYRVQRRLAEGTLREVLPDFPPPALPATVLYPRQRQLSPRVRVFADWLAEVMAVAA
ncbi:transcriptional regulator, LysR family [Pseudoduganella lurida]|uniref:Transcriptional regulator, LysR family n=1 Tax=Pseudoduganella lurida TaxID=1036180 RepID=A0A562RA11_9BURK|nr:LysR family transcriptional regulator [Pseudoduganella lurida]TWI65226.1 transcriptional regulator, LysR family [Pseudoduganella lurida]